MDKIKGNGVIKTVSVPDMNGYDTLFINELKKHDIILPKQIEFECDLRTQYSYWHNSFDYHCIKQIIHELSPEYDNSFNYIFEENNKMSLYCMFVSRYTVFDEYFKWLFPILFEAERRIDVSNYDSYQKRVFAFLAERLINVYVYHNKLNISYKPIYFITNDIDKIKIVFLLKNYVKAIIKLFIPYGILKFIKYMKKRKLSQKGYNPET